MSLWRFQNTLDRPRPDTSLQPLSKHGRRLKVLAPRLREGGAGSSERQSGKGLGESTLSLDKRANRDRIAEINAESQTRRPQFRGFFAEGGLASRGHHFV